MQTWLRQMWVLVLIGMIGATNVFANEAVIKKILEDPDLFSREEVSTVRERAKSLAAEQSAAILSVAIQGRPSLDVVEEKYGKSDSTLDTLPMPPENHALTVHWYGTLGLAVVQGDKKRPIVGLFVEGPKELP